MLLRRLELTNFRQYKGTQTIEFSVDKRRNVTVVLGRNTSGKTTLIQAFNWILYGKANFETSDFLLNLDIAQTLQPGQTAVVKGVLQLVHNDTEYTITRQQDYSCHSTGVVRPSPASVVVWQKLDNGETRAIGERELEDTINRILPEDLSNYFFFDGERIGSLGKNDRRGRRDIANAVRGVLGLTVLDSAITHLSGGEKTSVIGKLKNSIDDRGDAELQRKKRELQLTRQRLEELTRRVQDYDETIEYYSTEIEKKEDIIKANRHTSHLKRDMQKNEREIARCERMKEEVITKLTRDFSKFAPMFFMQPLITRALSVVKEHGAGEQGVPEMHAKSIDFLIKRGRCICGTPITNGNEAYRNLLQQKDYLPPQSIGTLIRVFMTDARHYRSAADGFYEKIREAYTDVRRITKEISELKSANAMISEQIAGQPDIGQYEEEVRRLKSKLEQCREEKENTLLEIGNLKARVELLETEIEGLASASDKNKFVLTCLNYAKQIEQELKAHYRAMESITRKKLEERVNQIFSKMYHGQRSICINTHYEYDLVTPNMFLAN